MAVASRRSSCRAGCSWCGSCAARCSFSALPSPPLLSPLDCLRGSPRQGTAAHLGARRELMLSMRRTSTSETPRNTRRRRRPSASPGRSSRRSATRWLADTGEDGRGPRTKMTGPTAMLREPLRLLRPCHPARFPRLQQRKSPCSPPAQLVLGFAAPGPSRGPCTLRSLPETLRSASGRVKS